MVRSNEVVRKRLARWPPAMEITSDFVESFVSKFIQPKENTEWLFHVGEVADCVN